MSVAELTINSWTRPRPGTYHAKCGEREARISRYQDGRLWYVEGHGDYHWQSLGADRNVRQAKLCGQAWLEGDQAWKEYLGQKIDNGRLTWSMCPTEDEELTQRSLAVSTLQKTVQKK